MSFCSVCSDTLWYWKMKAGHLYKFSLHPRVMKRNRKKVENISWKYSAIFPRRWRCCCHSERFSLFTVAAVGLLLQGADNKLGQFLNQDIYRTDNHRNILRHSLERWPSLVCRNVNKLSLAIKYVGRVRNFCSCAKSFAHPRSENHPFWVTASLKIHWSKEIWPPSSQGCNPLDYFIWCVV